MIANLNIDVLTPRIIAMNERTLLGKIGSFLLLNAFLIGTVSVQAQSLDDVLEEIRKSREQAFSAIQGKNSNKNNRITFDAEEPTAEIRVIFQVFRGGIVVSPYNEGFEEVEVEQGTMLVIGQNVASSKVDLVTCTEEQDVDAVLGLACPKDSDEDGLLDHLDRCPDTRIGADIDDLGCEIIHRFADLAFTKGSSQLTQLAKSRLKEITNSLMRIKLGKYAINGHTDSQGSEALNMKLSKKRADAVTKFLVQTGVAADRLTVRSFGETKPIADNSTSNGREINRRVEIIREPNE